MKCTKQITFKIVAYTDAAGRYSPDAFRNGNEDNFYVNCDLTGKTAGPLPDEAIQLGDYGMVMAVADGMGGANAGEVASQIAVDTLNEAFKIGMLSETIVRTSESRQKYMEQVIKETDRRIKTAAGESKETAGMGSTMIIAWLFDNELTISWCGDSRAYIFNERTGIRLISMDHSYVQELVNKGVLSYEQTFDHPQNNIITRSLGDPSKAAKPESKTVEVGKGDIILLNSDGLSGVLRDRKTYDSAGHLYPEDNLEDIISTNTDSMEKCREALWLAAEKGEWYDNVTVILCQITEGPESVWTTQDPTNVEDNGNGRRRRTILIVALCVILLVLVFLLGLFIGRDGKLRRDNSPAEPVDTTIVLDQTEEETVADEDVATNCDNAVGSRKGVNKTVKPDVRNDNESDPQTGEKSESERDTTSNKGILTKIAPKGDNHQPPRNELTPIAPKKSEDSTLTKIWKSAEDSDSAEETKSDSEAVSADEDQPDDGTVEEVASDENDVNQ